MPAAETPESPPPWRWWLFRECAAVAVVTVLVAAASIPAIVKARRRGGSPPAIGSLQNIATGQALFRDGDKDKNGVPDFATLAQLGSVGLVDAVLAGGTKQGYVFRVAPSTSTPGLLWFAVANPVEPREGQRSFCTNHAGKIFATTTGPFALDTGACEIPPGALPVGR